MPVTSSKVLQVRAAVLSHYEQVALGVGLNPQIQLRQVGLTPRMLVSPSQQIPFASAVALLEKRKLVMRRVNRSDLRESFLSLTPEGRAIYEDLAPGAASFARHLIEAIDPADRDAFARALQCLIERAKPLADEAIDDPDR